MTQNVSSSFSLRVTVFLNVFFVEILRLRQQKPSPLRVTVFLEFTREVMYVGGRHPERGNLFPSRTGITSKGQGKTSDSSKHNLTLCQATNILFLNRASRLWKQNASATKLINHPNITPPKNKRPEAILRSF